ncbi:MAG: hypothetical protein HFJ87_06520 [Muribaculaceae bacterium]|nr:hypothetical protein [Muribaculaceae bacterium]
MKKAGTFILCMFGMALPVVGSPLTPEQALSNALATSKCRAGAFAPAKAEYELVWSGAAKGIYVFVDRDERMLVASGDDSYPALIGYGEACGASMSPGLEAFLKALDAQVASGAAPQICRSPSTRADIQPLVVAEWNQDSPYNDLCPTVDGSSTLAGCMAIAMAQIMNFHRHPACGTGQIEYRWESGHTSLGYDFGQNSFDWENITPRYGESSADCEKEAVAALVQACGMAAKMDYSPTFSGATDLDAALGLMSYLGYDDDLRLKFRDFYRVGTWTDMLYDELAGRRPVLYCGFSSAGGHAFVCDGYSGADGYDYFHINWGWGGVSNGYFLINVLNPEYVGLGATATGFNMMQSAITGIHPDDGIPTAGSDSSVLFFGYFSTGDSQYALTDKILFGVSQGLMRAGLYNMGLDAITGFPGVKLVPVGSGEPLYCKATSEVTLKSSGCVTTFKVSGEEFPESGTFTVQPAFCCGGEWFDVPQEVGMRTSVTATVGDGKVTFDVTDESSRLNVMDVNLASREVVNGQPFEITATLVSHDCDEPTLITPVLLDSYGYVLAQMGTRQVSIGDGEFATITWNEVFAPDVEPGTFRLGLLSGKSTLLYDPIQVAVVDEAGKPELNLSNVRINRRLAKSDTPVAISGTDLTLTFTLGCTGGYFDGTVGVAVFDDCGDEVCRLDGPQDASLLGGDQTNMSFAGDLDHLDSSLTYTLRVVAVSRDDEVCVGDGYPFSVPTASVVDGMCAAGGEPSYFTLSGLALPACPSTPGVYIVKKGTSVSKIIINGRK